ncbi:MAG: aldehyde:ferredoxin oxidoreductase [Candidatus Cloacimonetes bacterium]|nr:aldehyde:ferredoxin oxidoreductase [Candidatus Cloacimonadota bacterium]
MNIYQNNYDIEKIKAAHKLLAEFKYDVKPLIKGYSNQTLYINVEKNEIKSKSVSEEMKKLFTGGRGFNMKLLWDATNADTKWFSPENEIVIAAGPMGGITQYPGAGKSIVCGISPLTQAPVDSNVGGYFGPYLKFSGWDAIEVQGIGEKDVIVYINGDEGFVQIFEAPEEDTNSHLISEQMCDIFSDNEEDKKSIATVSAGIASENSFYGCLNFSFYDRRRKVARLKQAGRGGLGTLLRHKKVKALVCKFSGMNANNNNVDDIESIKKVSAKYHREMYDLDDEQCDMRHVGTAHLVEIMDDYDLLPTHNYQYGKNPKTPAISSHVWREMFTQGIPDSCWYGCTMQCAKCVDRFKLRTGPYKDDIVSIDGPEYETAAAFGANMGIFDPHFIVEANFYCDTYGIDTISWGTCMAFVMECYENGIINKEITGGYDLSFGKGEESLEMLHQMARGEDFGKTIGLGIRRLKKLFVEKYNADANFLQDIGMECKGMEYSEYMTKESLAMQGGYGLALKGAQHDEAWLIFMDMVNNQIPTFADKAEALHYFPMFRTWFGLMGLCKLPWNDVEPANNAETDEPAKVPEHVQNYVDIFNAVTGRNIDKEELILQSERIYNFQRVFNLRLGFGTREHDRIPYRSAGPVTLKEYESRMERYDTQLKEKWEFDVEGKTTQEKCDYLRKMRENNYQKLCDAVYERRGWDNNGVPTIEKMKELKVDLPGILEVLEKYYK